MATAATFQAAQVGLAIKSPSKFPIMTLKPMRLLTVIKALQPSKLEDASMALWRAFWQEDKDISVDSVILDYVGPVLGREVVQAYLAKECNDAKYKDALNAATKYAMDNGAYGAPWWVVTNAKGKTEPFFGSDRWGHICHFLEVPYYGSHPEEVPLGAPANRL